MQLAKVTNVKASLSWVLFKPISRSPSTFLRQQTWFQMGQHPCSGFSICDVDGVCDSSFVTAQYEITVDRDGYSQDWKQKGPSVSDATPIFSGDFSHKPEEPNLHLRNWDLRSTGTMIQICDTWMGYLSQPVEWSTRLIDPSLPAPLPEIAAPVIQDVFNRDHTWTTFELFRAGSSKCDCRWQILTPSRRMIMSQPAYIISIVLLGLIVIVIVSCYSNRPIRMLHHMMTTVASIIELFKGGSLVVEAHREGGLRWRRPFVLPGSVSMAISFLVEKLGRNTP